jgi:hypothetical protein
MPVLRRPYDPGRDLRTWRSAKFPELVADARTGRHLMTSKPALKDNVTPFKHALAGCDAAARAQARHRRAQRQTCGFVDRRYAAAGAWFHAATAQNDCRISHFSVITPIANAKFP